MKAEHRTSYVAAALLMPSLVQAQVVIPNSTTTVMLQSLDPTATDFVLPAGGFIETTAANGLVGDNSRAWNVINRGAIAAANEGLLLQSPASGALRFENFGTVSTRAGNWSGAGVELQGTGVLINHQGASITSSSADAVFMWQAGSTVQNDGILQATAADMSGVIFSQGGTFIQGPTGRVFSPTGIFFETGTVTVRNAGVIGAQFGGVWLRNGSSGTFDNTGGTIIGSSFAVGLEGGSVLDLWGGTLTASGARSRGLSAVQAASRLTARDLAVGVNGDEARAVYASSGGTVELFDVAVTVQGAEAAGVVVQTSGSVSVHGGSITATNEAAHGIRMHNDASVALAETAVTVTGANADVMQHDEAGIGTLTASGSTLVSRQGSGIAVSGGTLNATLTATSLVGSAALLDVTGGSTLNLTAEAGSTLIGAALTEAGSTSNLVLRDSTWHVTGDSRLTSLNNDPSQVLFSAPAGGVYKTLTVGQYTGDGTIGVNTYLGGDGSPSDRLVIDGGTASGTSKLRVTNAGGPGVLTTANGIQVIDTINGGTTQAGAFTLDGRAVAGPYEYRLYRGGTDGTAPEGWFLRSEQSPTPPDPTPPDPTPPDPTPPTPVRPLYRPEVAAYLANQRLSGQMFVHSLHDRRGEPQATERAGAGWLRMVGKWEGGRSQDGVFKTSTDAFLLQGGAELATWPAGGTTGRLHAGVMGSYGNASSDAEAQGNSARAKGKVEGWALGIYGTWYQNDETKHGAYADTWFQYGWFTNRVEGEYLPTVKYRAHGLAVSGEAGYAVPLPGGWTVAPQAQVIYVDYSESDILERNGTRVSGASARGIVTRLGLRTDRTYVRDDGRKVQPYATVNWWYADTDSSIGFNQVPVGTMYPRNRFEAKVGANVALNRAWSGWANVSGAWGQQNYHQYAVRVGVRYAW